MVKRSKVARVVAFVVLLVSGMWLAAPARGQAPGRLRGPGDVEVDPVRCWWKTDRDEVRVGERFALTLTCGVVETTRIKVVPDLNALEPTTVQLQPFEVTSGTRHQDIVSAPWRYFQYTYTMRLVGDAFFGKDVDIPSLKITYNIQSNVAAGEKGRDLTYALPPLPMRIASLVPKKATDIRDQPTETFGDIEARQFRATAAFVAAVVLFGFALVFLGLAAARAAGRLRRRAPTERPLAIRSVLTGCLQTARSVSSGVARDGWSRERASQALTALRIASAVALGRPLAQSVVDRDVPEREGQLALRKGLLGRKRALVSAATTVDTISRQIGQPAEPGVAASDVASAFRRTGVVSAFRGTNLAALEDLRESLRVFEAARYSRNQDFDAIALDAALERGTDAIRRLRVFRLWPLRRDGALVKSAADAGGVVWSR
jgi:hypothetical protein